MEIESYKKREMKIRCMEEKENGNSMSNKSCKH